jgi:peptide chain release factor 1
MNERLEELAARYRELERELARPEHATDPRKLRELATELKSLRETVQAYDRWKQLHHSLHENESLLSDDDAEIRELARGR